jgi:hypothetical protein
MIYAIFFLSVYGQKKRTINCMPEARLEDYLDEDMKFQGKEENKMFSFFR